MRGSLLRSVLVGVSAAAASLSLGFPAGYWLARLPEKAGVRLLLLLTVPAVVPFILFGLSFLEFSRMLRIDRTLLAVSLGHIVVFCPIVTALCYHRCRQLDTLLEDAAREFGASEWRILGEIVGGQIWKSLLAAFLVVFVMSWDEFIIAWFVSGFEKTYPVFVRNALESTMSPEIHAAGVVVALCCCGLALLSIRLLTSFRKWNGQ
ncbi:MAG TPA: ABC transporter permease subunit [Thermoanaerobaculia bacterium]|nr:ABC transporter permease subunit [Thermoanaerobaculia bacterium]